MSLGDGTSGRLVLRLFGPPGIELDGEPVTIGRRKAVALLAYLAVTGQRHRRDSLVNLLWPDYDHTRGRAALRRTLYALNKTLGTAWLKVDREKIGLTPGGDPSTGSPRLRSAGPGARHRGQAGQAGHVLWVDVLQFRHQLTECEAHGHAPSQVCPSCVAPLTDAVALVRGDFMSGFSLKDSFNFDDWQVFQAEALKRELGEALDRLVRCHAGQRQLELAIGCARRRLALDPLNEQAHRQVMRLHAWSGQRSAAVRQYDECVTLLEEQLGVPPQEATTELYRAIKAGRPPPAPEAGLQVIEDASDRPPDLTVQPPAFLEGDQPYELPLFVARERELVRLGVFLDLARAGKGRVVFVTGEAGSGKTSLVQEFTRCSQAAHLELLSATGNCNAYTGIGDPYLPFREILELLTGDVQSRWAAGAMTGELARRLWKALPLAAQAVAESGPDLIDTFLPRGPLLERAATGAHLAGQGDWPSRLSEVVHHRLTTAALQSPQQSHLFEQYTRVLQTLAEKNPLLLVVDDLQWADLGSISLLFHLGRHLAGSRILVVGAYRPEEIAAHRDGPSRREEAAQASSPRHLSARLRSGLPEESGSRQAGRMERHPLASVVNELRRDFGDNAVNVDRAESRSFVKALLDSEPNRLGLPFRETLHSQTRGHPLFTIELLRGMQERGDLVRDSEGRWVEGTELDWGTLPARVEAAIAERVGRLSRPSQAVLRAASVEGEEFTAEVVGRVLGIDDREVVPRLSRELDRRHRLVRAQSIEHLGSQRASRYRFRNILFQKYLYDSLDDVERSYLHEDVGSALERLYVDRATEMPTIAPQLARHFEEAGITAKAVHYLHQAGERAVQLSAYEEGIAHLTRGLALLEDLPDSPASPACLFPRSSGSPACPEGSRGEPSRGERSRRERGQQELALQLVLGLAHIGHGGYSQEVLQAMARARDLCRQLGRTAQMSRVVGELSVFHYVRAEYHKARELALEALRLAQLACDPLLEALDHTCLGYILFTLGEYTLARTHLQQVIATYRPEQHHRGFVALRGSDVGLTALAYDACCLWCLGFPDQGAMRSQEALALARELAHPFSLTDVLCYGVCQFNEMRRDPQPQMAGAEELMQLAREKLHGWLGHATWHWGQALVSAGQVEEGIAQMRTGLEIQRRGPERCHRTGCLLSLAEAHGIAGRPEQGLEALEEGLSRAKAADERYLEAELYRVQADLLLMQGDEVGAEIGYHKAIEVARRQSAKSWELRATTSLARLWQSQGRGKEARDALAEVYEWFTEGFDTPDLQEAKALLEELKLGREGAASGASLPAGTGIP